MDNYNTDTMCGNFYCSLPVSEEEFFCQICVERMPGLEKNEIHTRHNEHNCARKYERIEGYCSGTTFDGQKFCSFCASIKRERMERMEHEAILDGMPPYVVACIRCRNECALSRSIGMHIVDVNSYLENYVCGSCT